LVTTRAATANVMPLGTSLEAEAVLLDHDLISQLGSSMRLSASVVEIAPGLSAERRVTTTPFSAETNTSRLNVTPPEL